MECRVCGRRFSPTAGLFAESDFCSRRCREQFETGEASSGIANLAQSVSRTENSPAAPEEMFAPFFGESARLRFPPVQYTTSRRTPPPLPARASPDPNAPLVAGPIPPLPSDRPAPLAPVAALALRVGAEEEAPGTSSGLRKKIAVGVLVAVIGFFGSAYLFHYSPAEPMRTDAAAAAVALAGAGWTPQWAIAPGGDEITIHTASLSWANYRVERKTSRYLGVRWIYRASDPKNYFILRLGPGRYDNVMKLTRWAVVGGVARDPVEADVPAGEAGGEYVTVKLEARGPEFRLFLDGEWATNWKEDRPSRGGFGLAGETAESIVANPVRVSQLH